MNEFVGGPLVALRCREDVFVDPRPVLVSDLLLRTLSVGFIEANGLMTVEQSFRVRPLAFEVTAELAGNYRDPRVREARRRRLIERVKAEVLTVEQATRLDALLRLWEEARTEYEASAQATTRPAEAP